MAGPCPVPAQILPFESMSMSLTWLERSPCAVVKFCQLLPSKWLTPPLVASQTSPLALTAMPPTMFDSKTLLVSKVAQLLLLLSKTLAPPCVPAQIRPRLSCATARTPFDAIPELAVVNCCQALPFQCCNPSEKVAIQMSLAEWARISI